MHEALSERDWRDLLRLIHGRQVVPVVGTTNETLLNGAAITSPQPLREGDVIAVGREAKGIAKLPLTARSA